VGAERELVVGCGSTECVDARLGLVSEGRAWVGEVCAGTVCEWSGGGGRVSGVKRCVVCGVGKMGGGRYGCRMRTGGGLWFY
jgi:hypothetical protein